MLALHAAWTGETLALWAEDPDKPRSAPKGRAKIRVHPFSTEPQRLAERLGHPGAEIALTLRLPSSQDGPLPSPQLWTGEDAPEGAELSPWSVPALRLEIGEALDLLLSAESPDGVVQGDSVRWMVQLARFALELCSRGQLLPSLVRGELFWEARWRPFTSDPDDASRLGTLVRGLPPVLRVSGERDLRPAELTSAVLGALVDAAAREALASKGRSRKARPAQTAEEAWLFALSSSDPRLPKGVAGLEALASKLEAWSRKEVRTDGFRTCFRVVAPEQSEAPAERGAAPAQQRWRVDFLLQATDDPSLLVPAQEIFRTRGWVLTLAERPIADPQEKLLGDLGRACRLAPVLQQALHEARPAGVEMDAMEAWRFLREAAPLLASSGFGVLAPRWWGRDRARLGLRMKATPRSSSGSPAVAGKSAVGLEALCEVSWEVALGDEALTLEELERLAAWKAPLVQLRGEWVELRPEDVEAALAFYRNPPPQTELSAREILRMGLGLEQEQAEGLPVQGLVATGWLGELLAEASRAQVQPLPAPEGFGAALRPYQQRGLGWLAFHDQLGTGACLADDMGLGKTVQLLALLVQERQALPPEQKPAPTLLVCPMSLVGNWQREAQKFAPSLRVVVHHGARRAAKAALARALQGADLVLTTYGLLSRDSALQEQHWGRVVIDEAQNIKNASTRQAKAVLALKARSRVALTGTPVENRLSELWSILEFLNPGLLGSAHAFRKAFAIPVERYGDEVAAQRLKRVTSPFVLRRLKTDKSIIADLPDKIEIKVPCHLTPEQASLYKAVVDELMEAVATREGNERRGAVLGAMTRLKQICDHPALMLQDRSALPGRSGKLARLEEILDEVVANGDKALVFTQFTEMGHPLKAHLQERLGREVLFLHGGTSREARDRMVARFSDKDGPSVFLLSLKAGGTGLNLVAAQHVVHFDRWWNPAVEDQATDRAFRLGQTRNVQVRKLVCAGTLEERIDAMIEDKRALAGKVVGTGEGWLADLSVTAIRELVALSEDAVAEG